MATKAVTKYRYRTRVVRARSRRSGVTLPVAVLAGFAPTAVAAYAGWRGSGVDGLVHNLVMRLTGFSTDKGTFHAQQLMYGWGPILLGMLAHKAANRFGVNRALANAGVPLLRI